MLCVVPPPPDRPPPSGGRSPIRQRLGVSLGVTPHDGRLGYIAVGKRRPGVEGEPRRSERRIERSGRADVVDDAPGPHVVQVVLRARRGVRRVEVHVEGPQKIGVCGRVDAAGDVA